MQKRNALVDIYIIYTEKFYFISIRIQIFMWSGRKLKTLDRALLSVSLSLSLRLWGNRKAMDWTPKNIYNLFSESIIPAGGENFLPLFFKSTSTIFFYCSDYHIILNSDFEKGTYIKLKPHLNEFYNILDVKSYL